MHCFSLLQFFQNSLNALLEKVGTTSQLLSLYFAAPILMVLIAVIFSAERRNDLYKVSGTLIVTSLSFAADNAWVYAIGVFVIATLVTDLEYLEKLAAIIWKSDSYWKYRLEKASPGDILDKNLKEGESTTARNSGTSEIIPALDAISDISRTLTFEAQVLNALVSQDGPFPSATFEREIKLTKRGVGIVLDGIIDTGWTVYIVEIKNRADKEAKLKAVHSLKRAVLKYAEYLKERGVKKYIKGFIVVPEEQEDTKTPIGPIPILKFNPGTNTFSNLAEIKTQIDGLSNAYRWWP